MFAASYYCSGFRRGFFFRWDFLFDVKGFAFFFFFSLVFLLAHPHMYAHIHAYRPILPSPLSCLAPVSIDTDGDGRKRYKERPDTEGMAAADFYEFLSALFPPFPPSIHVFS